MLAFAVVPSIADLTDLGNAARPGGEGGTGSGPDALADRFPDLAGVPPADRGGVVMGKIVSDMATGSLVGIWVGMFTAVVAGVGGAVLQV